MTSTRILVRNYAGSLVGMTAWVLQRVTGVLLLFYLLLHVETIHQLSAGPVAFDRALARYSSPLFRLLEIGLLVIVIVHALNGVRLTVLDLGIAHRQQRKMFWILAAVVGGALFIAGALPMFLFSVLRR
jgi:succinate dehydrogenase / fumarate reductase, cytochrome b subunit